MRQIGVLKELEEALSRGVHPGALACADRILGIDVGEAVLDRVFSTVCLGK